MEKWQGHTLSMSEEWILVCTYSGANSCKDVGVGDYGYVCWIKWARLLSLLKKIGRQDRSDDLSHYGIQSNVKFTSISNEKSSWMKFRKTWQAELGNQIAKQCLSNSGCGCLSPTCGHVCDARILANSGHGWGQCTHPLRHCARFFLCPRLGPQIWHRIRSCWDSSHCARYDLIRAPPTRSILLWIPEQRNFHFLQSGVC